MHDGRPTRHQHNSYYVTLNFVIINSPKYATTFRCDLASQHNNVAGDEKRVRNEDSMSAEVKTLVLRNWPIAFIDSTRSNTTRLGNLCRAGRQLPAAPVNTRQLRQVLDDLRYVSTV